jgi:hypothetical protein
MKRLRRSFALAPLLITAVRFIFESNVHCVNMYNKHQILIFFFPSCSTLFFSYYRTTKIKISSQWKIPHHCALCAHVNETRFLSFHFIYAIPFDTQRESISRRHKLIRLRCHDLMPSLVKFIPAQQAKNVFN